MDTERKQFEDEVRKRLDELEKVVFGYELESGKPLTPTPSKKPSK